MRIVYIAALLLIFGGCRSNDNSFEALDCYWDDRDREFREINNIRRLLISSDKIKLYLGSENIYSFSHEQIKGVYARRLPNDVYELSVELAHGEQSMFLLGNGNENCLTHLSRGNEIFRPKVF